MYEIETYFESAKWTTARGHLSDEVIVETPPDKCGVILDWHALIAGTSTHTLNLSIRATGQTWAERRIIGGGFGGISGVGDHYPLSLMSAAPPWLIVPPSSILTLESTTTGITHTFRSGVLLSAAPYRAEVWPQPNDTTYRDMVTGPVTLLNFFESTASATTMLFLRDPHGERFEFPILAGMWPRPFFVPAGWTVEFRMTAAQSVSNRGLCLSWMVAP